MPDTPASPRADFAQSFDAVVWAEAFVEHVLRNPAIATDPGTMVGWFANALMRGYDEYRWKQEREQRALAASAGPLSAERLRELRAEVDAANRGDDEEAKSWASDVTDLLTAYTALAAQVAQLTAGNDEDVAATIQEVRDEGRTAESALVNLGYKLKRARADLAALRATVDEWGRSLSPDEAEAYRTFIASRFTPVDIRTPTPEGQG